MNSFHLNGQGGLDALAAVEEAPQEAEAKSGQQKQISLLLVEDNPGDIELIKLGLAKTQLQGQLHIAEDGDEALAFIFRNPLAQSSQRRPDLVLLDINLPKTDGLEVLRALKSTASTRCIPVIMLTSSQAEADVLQSYRQHANSYITKPMNFAKLQSILASLQDFWFGLVTLPTGKLP